MDIYLPIIKVMLADWLQVSDEHPLFVAAIAFCVWILVAILYSFRSSGLKKQITALETEKTAAETALDTTQQQLQQAQDDLSTANQHFSEQKQASEALQQRAENVEKQLAERNQQLAAIIQKFASSFDLGERPVPVTADLKADDLWQQHDKVITKLLDNLRTEQLAKTELQKFYQAEKDKVIAIETRLHSLQSSFDKQTSLLTAVQNQNNALQQQQNAAQHELSASMQKHQADLARLTQLEVNALQAAPPTPVVTVSTNDSDKLKNLFKKPEPKPVVEPVIVAPEIKVPPKPIVTDVLITAVEEKTPPPVIIADIKPAPKPAAEVQAKSAPEPKKAGIKGLLNKFNAKPSVEKPIVTKPVPVVTKTPVAEAKPEPAPKEKTKLKGLFNKFTTKPEPAVKETPVAETKPEPTPVVTSTLVVEVKTTSEPIIPKLTATTTPTAIKKAKGAYPVPDSKLSDNIPSTRIEDLADKITDTVEGFKNLFSKKS